jgi:hypothetical protein
LGFLSFEIYKGNIIIKAVMGFRQFLLRALKKVAGEWDLVCIAYNLKRMYALSEG